MSYTATTIGFGELPVARSATPNGSGSLSRSTSR
jgi:hypothetical protein